SQQFRLAIDKLGHLQDTREIAKALASWKLLTKFQAKMLMAGRNSGFFIGPYRVLDQLGQGGMGRVYKAVHQTMNRVVALKVLTPQLVNTERAQQLFLREVQAAAQLSHPNIVMAFDANENDGRHYLAMEYVAGPNLERYVKKNATLPVSLASEIAFQTATGLHDVDIRSDLYSLGCTFYFLLTGQVPFPGGNTVDKLIRQNSEDAQPIEALRPDVPKKIANIVRKLMAKDPHDRYQTPDELM